jgi:glycosyltransferase involved in cell wall biosynthesis
MNDDGSTYYRMRLPHNKLKDLGYDSTHTLQFNDVDMVANDNGKPVSLYKYDIIFFQTITHSFMLPMLARLAKNHITIVLNIDDDYFNDSGTGSYYMPKADKDVIRQAMEYADNICVSTPELSSLYGKQRCTIIENYIDTSLYNSKKLLHDKFTIGWFGTVNHLYDLEIISGTLPDDIRLVIAGFPEAAARYFSNVKDAKAIGLFPISDLPAIISEIDLGLVPLVDNKFNQGKSDLKGVEFGAGHVPVIASNVAPYKSWIDNGINGYIANNSKDFIKCINKIRNDTKLMDNLSINARNKALLRDINIGINKYIENYNLIK